MLFSIVMIKFYILSKRLCVKRKWLINEGMVSLTKNIFAACFFLRFIKSSKSILDKSLKAVYWNSHLSEVLTIV